MMMTGNNFLLDPYVKAQTPPYPSGNLVHRISPMQTVYLGLGISGLSAKSKLIWGTIDDD